MNKLHFPYIALGLGLFLFVVTMMGNVADENGSRAIPLLTMLVISEFAFIVTGIGAFIGVRQIQSTGLKPVFTIVTILCILLAIRFMLLGIELWPL